MSIVRIVDLMVGNISDPRAHVTFRDSLTAIFKSNNTDSGSNYSGIKFSEYNIPDKATFLLFDLITIFQGDNPSLGNINVGIQPTSGGSYFRTVQGQFTGTLGLDVSTVSGQEVPWLAIGFPGGVFGATNTKPDFYTIISNLRFIDDETIHDEQLMDIPADRPPSEPTNLNLGS